MTTNKISFYFDFLSPYAYLAHHRLRELAQAKGFALDYHPVELDWIKLEAGNNGPATRQMPLKLAYARTDLQRWARCYGISLIPLKSYASRKANAGALFAIDRNQAADYVAQAWRRIYGEGNDMNDDAVLSEIADSMGWSPNQFLAFVTSKAAEQRLLDSNQRAHERGVFGVPTMIVGDDLWWGNDRIDFLMQHIESR